MKIYEHVARYFLGVWFLICAVDGWGIIFFDVYITGEPVSPFLAALVNTTWFWVFLKVTQTFGAYSMLFNYKPALGLAIITPASIVIVLFYIFWLQEFIVVGVLMTISTIVLARAYSASFMPLLKDYPMRKVESEKDVAVNY